MGTFRSGKGGREERGQFLQELIKREVCVNEPILVNFYPT